MAQLAMCFLCKHGEMSSDLQQTHEKVRHRACAREPALGRQKQDDPCSSLARESSQTRQAPGSVRDSVSKTKVTEEDTRHWPLACTHIHIQNIHFILLYNRSENWVKVMWLHNLSKTNLQNICCYYIGLCRTLAHMTDILTIIPRVRDHYANLMAEKS